MTDDELIAALRILKPTGALPGLALFRADLLEKAGIDLAHLERFAAGAGGGPVQAGAMKVRKGQRPEQGRPGRPEAFFAVPLALLD